MFTYKSRTSDLTSHFCVSCLCRKSTTLYRTYIHIHRKLTYLQHRIYSCEKDDDTGWRRLIGSPKLQIIFHKRATKYRSLLRKMTYKDKGSYESSPPCTQKYDVMSCVLNVYVNMNILYMSICQYSIYEYVRTEKSRAVAGTTMTHNNVMWCHMFLICMWTWIFYICICIYGKEWKARIHNSVMWGRMFSIYTWTWIFYTCIMHVSKIIVVLPER